MSPPHQHACVATPPEAGSRDAILTLALRNCLALSLRTQHYGARDDDWAHITRFCIEAGIEPPSTFRADANPSPASAAPAEDQV
jgi:hypothetical protein